MTEKEKDFLKQLITIRNYWINNKMVATSDEKLDGFIFSMLSMFDGVSGANDFKKITLLQDNEVINGSYGGVGDFIETDSALHDCYYNFLDEQEHTDGQA